MKIVAKTDTGLMIDLSRDELSQMAGKASDYRDLTVSRNGCIENTNARHVVIGDEITVSKIYEKARCIVDDWDVLSKSISSLKQNATKFQNAVKEY